MLTWIIGFIIFLAIVLAARSVLKSTRNGGCMGCGSCENCGRNCHKDEDEEEE